MRQHGVPLFDTEDTRELLLAWCAPKGQRGPGPLEGRLVEKRATAEGDGTGTARLVLDVLEREEVLPEFLLRDPGR